MFSPSYYTAAGWFILFAFFHSVTAHEWFKDRLAKQTSPYFVEHFWRIIYCGISLIMLKYGVYEPLKSLGSYEGSQIDLPLWLLDVCAVTFFVGLFLSYWAFLEFDFLEFLGIKQCYHGLKGLVTKTPPKKKEIAGTDRLIVQGVYHVVRHPMLAGSFLMAISGPPFFGTYLYSLLFFVYMVFGVYYEERRLIKNLGQDYIDYSNEVGAFFPKPKQFVRLYRYLRDALAEKNEEDALL